MALVTRALNPKDAGEFATLSAAIEADHLTSFVLCEEEAAEIFSLPFFKMEGAFIDGRLVAFSGSRTTLEPPVLLRVLLLGDVHPDHLGQGLGTLMARRALNAARAGHSRIAPALPVRYAYRGPSGRTDQARLLATLGLVPDRYRYLMVAELAGREAPSLPAGFDLRVCDPATDFDALHLAHNLALAQHPTRPLVDEKHWRAFMVDALHTRPQLSFYLTDPARGGQVAAFVFAHEYGVPMSGRPEGREIYIASAGTVPGYRGQGLATALLCKTLHAASGLGYDRASLEQDLDSPHGALNLYRRTGFETIQRFDEYALTEPPVSPDRDSAGQ